MSRTGWFSSKFIVWGLLIGLVAGAFAYAARRQIEQELALWLLANGSAPAQRWAIDVLAQAHGSRRAVQGLIELAERLEETCVSGSLAPDQRRYRERLWFPDCRRLVLALAEIGDAKAFRRLVAGRSPEFSVCVMQVCETALVSCPQLREFVLETARSDDPRISDAAAAALVRSGNLRRSQFAFLWETAISNRERSAYSIEQDMVEKRLPLEWTLPAALRFLEQSEGLGWNFVGVCITESISDQLSRHEAALAADALRWIADSGEGDTKSPDNAERLLWPKGVQRRGVSEAALRGLRFLAEVD